MLFHQLLHCCVCCILCYRDPRDLPDPTHSSPTRCSAGLAWRVINFLGIAGTSRLVVTSLNGACLLAALLICAGVAFRTRLVRRRSAPLPACIRSEEHTSELQSLMRNSYAVFCWIKKLRKYCLLR